MSKYVMGIDQSTQGTKIILFDSDGKIAFQATKSHKQFINDKGWVEHDPAEIWRNVKLLAPAKVFIPLSSGNAHEEPPFVTN